MSCKLAIALNPKIVAASQYDNYDFNSLCVFNGRLLGSNEAGIFELETGKTDAGEDINALVGFPRTNFGILRDKRIRYLLFGYRATGQLKVKITPNENVNSAEINDLEPTELGRQSAQKVYFSRDLRGAYFEIEISNADGAVFSVDAIDMFPELLTTKFAGS